MNKKRINKQGGFTLIELAVVMVIIGILLSAILKGQDLIDNARAKKVLADLKGMETMIWTFYDRQGRFPGDCDGTGFMGATSAAIATAGVDPTPLDGAQATASTISCDTILVPDADTPIADLRGEHLLDYATFNVDQAKHVFKTAASSNIRPMKIGTGTAERNVIHVYGIPQWVGEMIDSNIDGEVDGTAGRIRYMSVAGPNTGAGTAWPARGLVPIDVVITYFFDKQL